MKKWIIAFCAWLIVSCIGCANQGVSHVPNSISTVGSSLDQAHAHVDAAESDVQAAKPHTDSTGKTVLALASQQHTAANNSLSDAKRELGAAQSERDKLVKQNGTLIASNQALLNSWGHKFQVIVQAVLTWLIILIALHIVLGLLAMVLPPPYSVICGIIAKIINPLGWTTWLIANMQKNVARNVA